MDDNIIQHYTNQSAFLIEVSELGNGQFQVTLVEVWEESATHSAEGWRNKDASLINFLKHCLSRQNVGCGLPKSEKKTEVKAAPQFFTSA